MSDTVLYRPAGYTDATKGSNSLSQRFVASSYNSNSASAEDQTFEWRAEPTGNNTASPAAKLTLGFASGNASPTQTGLEINSAGIVTFAPGQTFPAATITTSAPLSGTGTSASPVTLSKADATHDGYIAAPDFASFAGKMSSVVHDSTLIGNGLGGTPLGVDQSVFALKAAANLFTDMQTITAGTGQCGALRATYGGATSWPECGAIHATAQDHPAVSALSTGGTAAVNAVAVGTSTAAAHLEAPGKILEVMNNGVAKLVVTNNGVAIGGGESIAAVRRYSETWDFGSVAAAGCSVHAFTATGVAVGDSVAYGPPPEVATLSAIQTTAYVSAANEVTIRVCNISAAAVNPLSATYRVTVFH